MTGVTKVYGKIAAIEDVNFSVLSGEVHALIGENGAGKSTLLNVLSGVRDATAGTVKVDGKLIEMESPLSARKAGIAMIHQELQLVPELTVVQNMFLGRDITKSKGLFVDKEAQVKRATKILAQLDDSIDPNIQIKELRVAQQQIVEIARALLDDAKVLAMDEPTSSLTPTEFERLAEIIADLKATGVGLIYVSHKMDEVFQVCDRATILRDGKQVGVVNIRDETPKTIVTKMIGREIEIEAHQTFMIDKEVLRLEELGRSGAVSPVSLRVNAGEVLGIAGLVGAGRTELLKLIAGIDTKTSGNVFVDGQCIDNHSIQGAIKAGIGLVPEDRKKEGIIKEQSIKMNVALPTMEQFSSNGIIKQSAMTDDVFKVMSELNLRPLDIEKHIGDLSGGNQQKAIIGRWVTADCKVILFDEPTRGIDVGAKSEIYNLIQKLSQQGKAIIVVSSEMPEIIRVSDRVIVMRESQVARELLGKDITEENIAQAAINDNHQQH
ncbi:sugar ABC transporter ATP-binding protein [Vibrio sp. DW001]|uniref:sugar ABC transporter ATP-binding protein n=1 Tax=Vibrio sp. DW001 TaxID=2912315 RepID=UPI0023AE710D|nr:sugar ABC transporter ATP-binding protein [Vibrio sp. DW001]WED25782.1 sugar ABC transporter ATP-binding protein [Vibrio sp. DW001]